MTLRNEPAIANAGAVVVEGFAIMTQIMIGIVVLMSLCAQRYDKDEHLNISFASDMRRLSTSKMSDNQFNKKLIRYARYSLTFQWLSYFICHILILTHEFVTEPDIVDHFIYITFLINLSCLFLTFRNIGIYFFFPFTDNKNFPNPIFKNREPITDLIDEKDDGNIEVKDPDIIDEHEDIELNDDENSNETIDNGVNTHSVNTHGRRFSHHHYGDIDLMPDPNKMIKKTGNEDWDNYNREKLEIRMNLVHLFRCLAYTSIIYWIGYIIASIHNKNDVVLATLALADILFSILVCGHMYYMKKLIVLFNKYEKILSYDDMEYTKRREERLFYLKRWFNADIGILIVLMVKCIVLLVRISTEQSNFSWPARHPVFLATTFVIIQNLEGYYLF
eukprot:347345_1